MALLTVGRRNSRTIELFYEDRGAGAPVVLVHGSAHASESWAHQVDALLEEGHRVVTYDRRGNGRSSRTPDAHDLASLAGDLHILMTTLHLQQAALVGHSLGIGDVLRYLRLYGSKRVSRAAFIAPLQALPGASDLAAIDVPVLVITTAVARTGPAPVVAASWFDLLRMLQVVVVPGAEPELLRSHAAEVNGALLEFIDG